MEIYIDHHSRVNEASFIEEPPTVLLPADSGHFSSKSALAGPTMPAAVRGRLAVHWDCQDGQNKPSGVYFGTQHLRPSCGLTTSETVQTFSDLCSKINDFSAESFC